jgi:hypothetical protein
MQQEFLANTERYLTLHGYSQSSLFSFLSSISPLFAHSSRQILHFTFPHHLLPPNNNSSFLLFNSFPCCTVENTRTPTPFVSRCSRNSNRETTCSYFAWRMKAISKGVNNLGNIEGPLSKVTVLRQEKKHVESSSNGRNAYQISSLTCFSSNTCASLGSFLRWTEVCGHNHTQNNRQNKATYFI